MEFRSLASSSLEDLIFCFTKAFADYSVSMPSELEYWKTRLHGARFQKHLSFGAFRDDTLVGFIWNCLDLHHGILSSYNTGTGVLPEFRGRHIVDTLYQKSIPLLQKQGVSLCSLEVIQSNIRAIKVYERIGFKIKKSLMCLKGDLTQFDTPVPTAVTEYASLPLHFLENGHLFSWDNSNEALLLLQEQNKSYLVLSSIGNAIGYFSINPTNGYLAQYHIEQGQYDLLFSAIRKVRSSIQINNIDESQAELLLFLDKHGFERLITQYEMEMEI